jgi:hypothetical protein
MSNNDYKQPAEIILDYLKGDMGLKMICKKCGSKMEQEMITGRFGCIECMMGGCTVVDKMEWISVKDRLPLKREDVIICNKTNQCVSVGWYNSEHNNGEGKWIIRTMYFDGDVELWMPLPDPPK